jgi:hypothetical protein
VIPTDISGQPPAAGSIMIGLEPDEQYEGWECQSFRISTHLDKPMTLDAVFVKNPNKAYRRLQQILSFGAHLKDTRGTAA